MTIKDLIYGVLLAILLLMYGSQGNTLRRTQFELAQSQDALATSIKYQDAFAKHLAQAWMDMCTFTTRAYESDEYEARKMECEVAVKRNLDSLVAQIGGE